MGEKTVQLCSVDGCEVEAAFTTRSRPAWCHEHVVVLFRASGVVPVEEFFGPDEHVLCECLACGCQTHIRLNYALEKGRGETCRACGWRAWKAWARGVGPGAGDDVPEDIEAVRRLAEANDYQYLRPLTSPSLVDDPHLVRCLACGRQQAERTGDIGWGCSCRVNPRRDDQRSPAERARTGGKRLLRNEYPDEAARFWDEEANDPALWKTLTFRARREVRWRCPDCDYRWSQRVVDMQPGWWCPQCFKRRNEEREQQRRYYSTVPVSDVPELLAAWAEEAVDPQEVMVAGGEMMGTGYRWRCAEGHHPRLYPWQYWTGGCPSCKAAVTRRRHAEITAEDPGFSRMDAEMRSQFHPTRNKGKDPAQIGPSSRAKIWWLDPECGHEWVETPHQRGKRYRWRCPECRTVLDSLAWHYPELAEEWADTNLTSPWKLRPSAKLAYTPEWVCSKNPEHRWQASMTSRAQGGKCPECIGTGKSAIELEHHRAAEEAFGNARSGVPLYSETFTHRGRWVVDILCTLPDAAELVIEYDGAYWHCEKAAADTGKSLDLLQAGYLVVRLREDTLPSLDIDHPKYTEFTVYSAAPDAPEAIANVHHWARQQAEAGER